MLKKNSICINHDGFIEWLDDDLDTSFNDIRILSQNHSLFYVNQKILMWRYPPEVFQLFDKVYILTYQFDASILKYYFDLHAIEYETMSVKKENEKYCLCNYYKPDVSIFKDKIHIYKGSDLNDSFVQKNTALSVNWFKNPANASKVKMLKNNIYNYFTNKKPAKNKEIMWTTFKDYKPRLKGKGYSSSFVPCNCRATNDYAEKNHLCYCSNVFPHLGISQFYLQHGIDMNQDLYALSELLQWIWRSAIRKGDEIWIYIPSKRKRKLLTDWLNGDI